MGIEEHLNNIANSFSGYSTDVQLYLSDNFEKNWSCRRNKQLSPFHVAAFFLSPQNYNALITLDQQNQIIELFECYIPDHIAATNQFFDYRAQHGNFKTIGRAWTYTENPELFWKYHEAPSPVLSSFSKRLLTTITNSVPSERAFSNMNYIHSKTRNRLTTTRADKL
jgi:hypothetical protein